VNDRTGRAYQAALRETQATALTDTSVTNRWYDACIGTVHCTEVEGTAIR
jgi:hypothetical protein